MKEKILWKSWELMSLDEQATLRKEYKENLDYECDEGDEEKLDERIAQYIDDTFDDDFGESGNWKYSSLANQKVEVQGVLGLWNGKHKITPKRFDNLREAILACMEDYNIIAEDSYGNLIISAYHHDGQNLFKIKKVTDKGVRCLHFRREVFGCR